jgi:anti-sigma factor RsiW
MHCSDCSQQLSLCLDDLLDQEQASRLQGHLAACEDCRAEWEAMRRVSSLLETEPLLAPAPDFTARVVLRLQQRETRRRRVRSTLGVLMGSAGLWVIAAVALTLLLAVLWQPSLRVVWSDVLLPLADHISAIVAVLGRSLYVVARELCRRPTLLLLPGYALLALMLSALWARVVLRPREPVLHTNSKL